MNHLDLVDLREIGRRCGISTNHVSALTRQPDFPEPAASLSIGDVWVWGSVYGWAHHHGFDTDRDLVPLTFTQQLDRHLI